MNTLIVYLGKEPTTNDSTKSYENEDENKVLIKSVVLP